MKKIMILILALVMAVSLCGCSSKKSDDSKTDDSAGSSIENEQKADESGPAETSSEEVSKEKEGAQVAASPFKEPSVIETTVNDVSPGSPFYGIWCLGSKEKADADAAANDMRNHGFNAQVYITTEWSNLNKEKWYVVSAGIYATEAGANEILPKVQEFYQDAYVKYSGDYLGSSQAASAAAPKVQEDETEILSSFTFYGIWCQASKDLSEAEQAAKELQKYGFDAGVCSTNQWSNLNPEPWYAVTAGYYSTESEAKAMLPQVQAVYPDAYVKYSGKMLMQ